MAAARILVIEDDPASRDLIAYLLGAFGYAVSTAADGPAGLAALRATVPDLVICDIHLPGLDGRALAERARAEAALRAIPLIAVTASAMVGDRQSILDAGFDAYISKPIDPETFVPQVEALLAPQRRAVR